MRNVHGQNKILVLYFPHYVLSLRVTVSLAMMRSIPFFGGFVEPFMTVVLAERFERALRQSK
jgi:hypothetical protein